MAAKTLLLEFALDAEHHFWSKVDRRGPDECWPWTAGTTGGYGKLKTHGRWIRAHRLAWRLAKGPIAAGLFVLHRCDNPPCCNPRHLFVGTDADNAADREAKGRGRRPFSRGEANPNATLGRYGARIVCRMATSGKWTLREAAAAFRISESQASRIKLGQQWASATADIRATALLSSPISTSLGTQQGGEDG